MKVDLAVLAVSVFAFTVTAAITDLRAKRLPNALTVSACVAGLLFQVIRGIFTGGLPGAGWGLLDGLGGFAVGFGLPFVLWLIGTGGGGDVKYMAALGAWMGWPHILYVFVIGLVLAVVGSMGVLAVEAIRLGFGRAKARYVTAGGAKVKGSAEAVEAGRQNRLTRRRLMPWAIPAGVASWLVVANMIWKA
jgi:prepilin peptidase CpaA